MLSFLCRLWCCWYGWVEVYLGFPISFRLINLECVTGSGKIFQNKHFRICLLQIIPEILSEIYSWIQRYFPDCIFQNIKMYFEISNLKCIITIITNNFTTTNNINKFNNNNNCNNINSNFSSYLF